MRFLANVCKFLCVVIAFAAFGDESRRMLRCAPETEPRPVVMTERTSLHETPRIETSTTVVTLGVPDCDRVTDGVPCVSRSDGEAYTIVISEQTRRALIEALRGAQTNNGLAGVTIPTGNMREVFVALHLAIGTQRE